MAFRATLLLTSILPWLTPFTTVEAAPASPKAPNFIHIMVDDMAADSMGFAGRFPFMKTPHLDALASNGLVFDQFFVTTSLCSPSRATILTGRYGHGTGVPDNSVHRDPDPDLPTYPQVLQEAGYVTGHIGKWHMGKGDHPRPGFTHWYGFDGQGVYFDPVLNRNGQREQVEGYLTDIITDEAVAFIEANKDRPFALNLWHKAAHGPFKPAPRHEGVLEEVDYPKPTTWENDLRDLPDWVRRSRAYGGVHLNTWLASEGKPIPEAVPARPFNRENVQKYLDHLSTLLAVDDSLGRVMEALEANGLLDNTVVIFTADNGFFLGEFARGDKRLPYEPSIRVPMILHYPPLGRSGERISAIGLNVDFAPTLIDWAGLSVPETMQGQSLLPVLLGQMKAVRLHFLYTYFQEEYAPGIPTILALRTNRWKYVQYPYEPGAIEELYDLQSDPHEQFPMADDPRYQTILQQMRGMLEAEKARLDYRRPAYHYDPAHYSEGQTEE